MENEKIETVEVLPVSVVEAQARAEIDVSVNTAKRFPRSVDLCVQKAIATVTRDKDVAETCHYSLQRGGKSIQGPSVHFARILASEYKNIRVDSKIVDIGDTMLTAQSVCMDLESNYAVRTEVKRRITDKHGQRYNEDMIVVTANAALSIAARNAILQVIPRSITDQVYTAVKRTLVGNLTDEQKLIKRRQDVLQGFEKTYNVKESQILELLDLETINQIKEEQLLELIGLAQAIKDGDTTVKQIFGKGDNPAKNTIDKVAEAKKAAEEARKKKEDAEVLKAAEAFEREEYERQQKERNGSGNKE